MPVSAFAETSRFSESEAQGFNVTVSLSRICTLSPIFPCPHFSVPEAELRALKQEAAAVNPGLRLDLDLPDA